MTLKCQNCGYVFVGTEYNFCSECGLEINRKIDDNNLAEQEKDKGKLKTSIFKIKNKITQRHERTHFKSINKPESLGFTNLKCNIYKITSFSHNATSNIVNEIICNVDEGFDKIRVNVDCSLKSIIKSTNDPNVIMVTKALSKHSPKIALLIASYALAGVPYGTVITQIAGFAVGQLAKSGDTPSTDKYYNMANASSIYPIVETIVNQMLHNTSKSASPILCMLCGHQITADARFCSNCGKGSNGKLENNGLANP